MKPAAKQRIIAIDILKMLAVFVVLNSHMELCYGEYSTLATGGAIGDALFFFCSGFMLFRGPDLRFDNYMKRRIARIYPTVFVVAIVGALLFGHRKDIVSIILSGGGWFVSCIMIYYAVLWGVKRYCRNVMWLVWVVVAAVILVWFYGFFDVHGKTGIYGETYFKWAAYFIFMLQGAVMGAEPARYSYDRFVIPKLLGCIAVWYAAMYACGVSALARELQVFSLLPLVGVSYYFYLLCCAPWWQKLYGHRVWGQVIFIIGGICLECYLIQGFLFTDRLNGLFPLNIPIIMIFVLAVAYAINFFSTAFAQTFRKEEYSWSDCLLRKKS